MNSGLTCEDLSKVRGVSYRGQKEAWLRAHCSADEQQKSDKEDWWVGRLLFQGHDLPLDPQTMQGG